jgi:Flp pilus assembly protein TadD
MRRRVLLSLFCVFASWSAAAQDPIEVRAPGFLVLSEAGEKKGREAGLRFEQMRRLYAALLPREQMAPLPAVQVIAFKSAATMRAALPVWQGKPLATDALWVPAGDRFYALIDAGNDAGWSRIFRAYAGMALDRNLPRTPRWFDEGFADYFASAVPDATGMALGRPIPEYEAALRAGLLPMEPFLNETQLRFDDLPPERRLRAQAQSWLMVHYIFHTHKIEAATEFFVATIRDELPPAQALERAFGMTAEQFGEELRKHLAARGEWKERAPLPAGVEAVMFPAASLKPYQWQTVLADVQGAAGDPGRALPALRQVVEAQPYYAAGHAALALALYREGDRTGAWEHVVRALELDTTDARAYHLAGLIQWERRSDDGSAETLVDINQDLDRAIALSPSFVEAMRLKAKVLVLATNLAEAIRTLRDAIRLQPRNESLLLELGQALRRNRKLDEADAIWARLRRSPDPAMVAAAAQESELTAAWRKDPMAQLREEAEARFSSGKWKRPENFPPEDADELERLQAERDRPVKKDLRKVLHAEGVLTDSVCDARAGVTLHVVIGKKRWTFRAPGRHTFVVIGADEFDCAWANVKVSVNYKPSGPAAGDLVSLELP